MIHLNDLFWTVQGEGLHAGRRALFVRMPYCDLKCSWCDTQFNSHAEWSELKFSLFAREEKARFAVVTGGEPMMHKHTPTVVRLLKEEGFEVACETNGNFPIVDGVDFVTCSPKRDSTPPYNVHPAAWPRVHEFKYVVDEGFEFGVLDRHDTRDGRRYSLSPEFNGFKDNVGKILDYTKERPDWRLNLQGHKWIGVP